MWTKILLIVLALGLAAMSNAVMDTLVFRYEISVFPKSPDKLLGLGEDYYNPQKSWRAKYALDSEGDLIAGAPKWYYFGLYTPMYKEAFPYSTTIFAFLTDGWHFAQFLMLSFFQLALTYLLTKTLGAERWWYYLLIFVGIKIVFGLVFNLCFSALLQEL